MGVELNTGLKWGNIEHHENVCNLLQALQYSPAFCLAKMARTSVMLFPSSILSFLHNGLCIKQAKNLRCRAQLALVAEVQWTCREHIRDQHVDKEVKAYLPALDTDLGASKLPR